MANGGPSHGGDRPALGGDLILPILAVAFTVYFFVSVSDLAWEAKANATMIGVVLLALVALQIARIVVRVLRREAALGLGAVIEPAGLGPTRLALIALSALFIALIPWLGLTLGLFLFVAALMMTLRAGSLRAIVATSAVIAGCAYALFIALLNSRLPHGPVEDLLAALF